MNQEEQGEEKLHLFKSETKDIFKKYPELSRIEEFKGLTTKEMAFVWWYRCPDNEISDMTDDGRLRRSLTNAYKPHPVPQNIEEQYMVRKFPDKIKFALERMSKFRPDYRSRAKNMLEKIIDKYEGMIDVPESEFSLFQEDEKGAMVPVGVNWTAKKQYIDSCKTIAGALPTLINQLEEGFGVTKEEKEKDKETGRKGIDKYHNQKKENL